MKKITKTKTTAASEKAKREQRTSAKAPKGKMASQLQAITDLKASGRYTYVGVEKPTDDQIPEGCSRKRVVNHHAKKLAVPVWIITKPEGVTPSASSTKSRARAKRATKASGDGKGKNAKGYYCGDLDSPKVQEVLKKIERHTKERPLTMTSFGTSQYPKRIARMLASEGLVVQEKRDEVGTVFYGKPTRAAAAK